MALSRHPRSHGIPGLHGSLLVRAVDRVLARDREPAHLCFRLLADSVPACEPNRHRALRRFGASYAVLCLLDAGGIEPAGVVQRRPWTTRLSAHQGETL